MGLQIEQDVGFQKRERVARLAGVTVIVLVLVAGLLGLAGGPGLLSTATASSGDRLVRVEFQRFVHREADDFIRIGVDARAVTADSVDVELASAWLSVVDIRGLVPEPAEQIQTSDSTVLRMPTSPGAAVTIRVSYRAIKNGIVSGWARVPGGEQASFRQFVYP